MLCSKFHAAMEGWAPGPSSLNSFNNLQRRAAM
jgi:hypothetical protein